ncbi:MAG: DUF192 domain-containing protein [Halosimplex sp.]
MERRRIAWGLTASLVVLVAGVYGLQSGLLYQVDQPDPGSYDRVTVTAYDDNGTELATVRARVADTRAKRVLGLSDTATLPMGEGMLFVHAHADRHGYVMRDMSFPLDMVFVGGDERITVIHHAAVPDGKYETVYRGRAKWVLEVPRGWANRTGVDEGDRIAIPESARTVGS